MDREEIKRQIDKWVGRDYVDDTSRRLLTTAMDEIERLQCQIADLKVNVHHWKANHGLEVQRARILKERPDMPIERVKAYEQIGRLQLALAQIEATRGGLRRMMPGQPDHQARVALLVSAFKGVWRIARTALKEQ